MKDYKRLTKWEYKGCASVNGGSPIDRDLAEAINRLAELEDKIENGSLIEMPRIVRRVDMSCGYEDYLVQWEKDNGKIKSRAYSNEKRAKAKLRELKGERQ